MIKKHKFGIMLAMLVAAVASAGSVHVWASGEYITSTDLNATITHLHNNLGHGHGPVLVNSDINTAAAISHAKLATPALLPKAWVSVGPVACSANPCTIAEASVVTGVGWTSAGLMTVNYPARPNANFMTQVTSFGATLDSACKVISQTTTVTTVQCVANNSGTAVAANSGFNFLLLDVEN